MLDERSEGAVLRVTSSMPILLTFRALPSHALLHFSCQSMIPRKSSAAYILSANYKSKVHLESCVS